MRLDALGIFPVDGILPRGGDKQIARLFDARHVAGERLTGIKAEECCLYGVDFPSAPRWLALGIGDKAVVFSDDSHAGAVFL